MKFIKSIILLLLLSFSLCHRGGHEGRGEGHHKRGEHHRQREDWKEAQPSQNELEITPLEPEIQEKDNYSLYDDVLNLITKILKLTISYSMEEKKLIMDLTEMIEIEEETEMKVEVKKIEEDGKINIEVIVCLKLLNIF
jgi:hypothetical protein